MTKEEIQTLTKLTEVLYTLNVAFSDVKPTKECQYAYDCAMKALSHAGMLVTKLTNTPCTHCDGTGKVSIYD